MPVWQIKKLRLLRSVAKARGRAGIRTRWLGLWGFLDSEIKIRDIFPSTLTFSSFFPKKYMMSCPSFVPENLLFKI